MKAFRLSIYLGVFVTLFYCGLLSLATPDQLPLLVVFWMTKIAFVILAGCARFAEDRYVREKYAQLDDLAARADEAHSVALALLEKEKYERS